MSDASHPAWIEIDVARFKRNIATVRREITSARLCVPIKANAYGHGLVPMARALVDEGIEYLAVAHSSEAVTCRRGGITAPILVLGAIHEEQIDDLLRYDIDFTISSAFKARLVAERCRARNKRCRVHLEVDTGMRRTGMRPETTRALYRELTSEPYAQFFDVVGIYSHLATGTHENDKIALDQIEKFSTLMLSPEFASQTFLKHLGNSAGMLNFSSAHFDMVRPALLCFGYAAPLGIDIEPCFSLKARVAYFKVVDEGEGISYGHSYVAPSRSRIVTIPVGYGDGFRRALSNRGSVLIRNKRYPIVGTICMDQFMVNVGNDDVYVGDEVVLIGRSGDQEISVAEIASLCDTIPYEILCNFNERIPRIYRH